MCCGAPAFFHSVTDEACDRLSGDKAFSPRPRGPRRPTNTEDFAIVSAPPRFPRGAWRRRIDGPISRINSDSGGGYVAAPDNHYGAGRRFLAECRFARVLDAQRRGNRRWREEDAMSSANVWKWSDWPMMRRPVWARVGATKPQAARPERAGGLGPSLLGDRVLKPQEPGEVAPFSLNQVSPAKPGDQEAAVDESLLESAVGSLRMRPNPRIVKIIKSPSHLKAGVPSATQALQGPCAARSCSPGVSSWRCRRSASRTWLVARGRENGWAASKPARSRMSEAPSGDNPPATNIGRRRLFFRGTTAHRPIVIGGGGGGEYRGGGSATTSRMRCKA